MKAVQPTVTATYHAAEISKLNQRIVELEEHVKSLKGELEEEVEETHRSDKKLALAEAALKNVDDGWAYREYEERLYEEKL